MKILSLLKRNLSGVSVSIITCVFIINLQSSVLPADCDDWQREVVVLVISVAHLDKAAMPHRLLDHVILPQAASCLIPSSLLMKCSF